jgi:hypothetical protein
VKLALGCGLRPAKSLVGQPAAEWKGISYRSGMQKKDSGR